MNTTPTIYDLDKRSKLTGLWVFVFLNMIFRDLHQFGNREFVEDMLAGVAGGVEVTDGLMLIGGIMIAIPLLIIPLIQFLNPSANRMANLLIGVLHFVLTIFVNRAPDLDDIFFAVIVLTTLLLIIRLAWSWNVPSAPKRSTIMSAQT